MESHETISFICKINHMQPHLWCELLNVEAAKIAFCTVLRVLIWPTIFFLFPTDEKYSCSWSEIATLTCDRWIMEGIYDPFLKYLFWFLLVWRCSTEVENSIKMFTNILREINITVKNNCISLTVSLSVTVSKVKILFFSLTVTPFLPLLYWYVHAIVRIFFCFFVCRFACFVFFFNIYLIKLEWKQKQAKNPNKGAQLSTEWTMQTLGSATGSKRLILLS